MRRGLFARCGAVALGLGLVGLLATPALAAGERGRILEVTSFNGQVRVLFSGVGLSPGVSIDPATVKVTLDGAPLPTQGEAAGKSIAVRRTAIIVIDTSGSMLGERLAGAKSAAQTFLSTVPADVQVGLITLSTTATVAVPPTGDRAKVLDVVRGLVAAGNTALYDAAALGVRTAGTTGARTVLLLTDGLDDGSKTDLAQAVDTVKRSGVLVSAVALGTGFSAPLAQISAASGGTVVAAPRAGDLAGLFRAAAQSISQQVVATATLPDNVKTSGTVTISAAAGGTQVSDSAFTTLSPKSAAAIDPSQYAAKPVDPDPGPFASHFVLLAALAALFIGVTALLGTSAVAASRDRGTGVRRRLSVYTLTGRAPTEVRESTALGNSAVARSAVDLADRVVASRDIEARLVRRLEAAGVPLRPAEWLLLQVGVSVGAGALFLLLSAGDPLALLVGLVLGAVVPFLYLSFKEGRRTKAFLGQLADTLQLVAGSLSAGYSLPQALDTVVREGSQPIAGEFNRALVESRLGVPVEDALEGIAERMKSEDFAWVVMAVRIQREVGGNLAEVLNTVAATLRERERLRRQVQVLSAEGKLSAYILGGLPFIFGLYLLLVRRAYITPLYTDPIGIFLLVVLAVQLTVGGFWLRKVVKVEV